MLESNLFKQCRLWKFPKALLVLYHKRQHVLENRMQAFKLIKYPRDTHIEDFETIILTTFEIHEERVLNPRELLNQHECSSLKQLSLKHFI